MAYFHMYSVSQPCQRLGERRPCCKSCAAVWWLPRRLLGDRGSGEGLWVKASLQALSVVSQSISEKPPPSHPWTRIERGFWGEMLKFMISGGTPGWQSQTDLILCVQGSVGLSAGPADSTSKEVQVRTWPDRQTCKDTAPFFKRGN